MTHRTLSKNNQSGRYTEFKPVFFAPSTDRPLVNAGTSARPELVNRNPVVKGVGLPEEGVTLVEYTGYVISQFTEGAWKSYESLVSEGVAKEIARTVLPVSTYTSLYMTGNLHAWFNFLRLRNGSHGHPQHEVVEVAQKVEKIIAELFPITYRAWKESHGG